MVEHVDQKKHTANIGFRGRTPVGVGSTSPLYQTRRVQQSRPARKFPVQEHPGSFVRPIISCAYNDALRRNCARKAA